LLDLMRQRLERWMEMADERLRPIGKPVFWMLGNDDPPSLVEPLRSAPWGEQAEGRVIPLDDEHAILSWGWSNPTPWHSFREMSEDELAGHFEELFGQVSDPHRVVFNAHVPPFDTGLDEAPVLDAQLTVTQQAGQVKLGPVGSTAVRAAIERHQPLAGLHGHVHESAGFRRIGNTVSVNPGSDYGTGSLNGALMTLSAGKLKSHQLVRG
jgi:Icc-related predicted phosphoesterase